MAASIKVPTIFTAEDKFTSVVRRMISGVSKFSKQTGSSIERLDQKISGTFAKLGRFAQIGLGVGLAGLFTMAIQGNIKYEDSLASVSAITGAVGDDLVRLETLSKQTGKAQKMMGADVLKAYELIGSAKPELLTNAALLDEVANSAITLSKAGRMELAPAAESLTTTLNQFALGGEHSGKVIDMLAAGAKYGSSVITDTATALSKFGTIAAATGTQVDESIALIQLVSPFEKGAEAGTKLRNVLGKIAGAEILPAAALKTLKKAGVNIDIVTDSSLDLDTRLKEMSKVGGDTTAVMQVFGQENAALAQAIFNNVDKFDDMLGKVRETGVAEEQAATNTNTFRFALDSIKSSFINATTATQSNNEALNVAKDMLFWVGNNMETLIGIVVAGIGSFVIFKGIVWGMRAATFAYNVVLGIQAGLQGKLTKAVALSSVQLGAYKAIQIAGSAATWIATAATTAFGIALNLSIWPILLIVAAIAGIIAIIMNWSSITDWFGEKWAQFTDWISKLWDDVISFFTEFDFKKMFMDIGQSIIKFMLMPLQGILTLLSKLPGKLGEMASLGLEKLNGFTGEFDVNNEGEGGSPKIVPSPEERNGELIQETKTSGRLDVNFNDPQGRVKEVKQSGNLSMPVVTSTQGAS